MDRDFTRELNNYLQGHPWGNLTPYLSWDITQSGPNHQVTYYANAKFNGARIGSGWGTSQGNAKKMASADALKFFTTNPPERFFR